MNRPQKQTTFVAVLIVVLLALDQALKLYIHSHFTLGESVAVLPFFELCYVENNGMAFGIEWFSKLCLTLFRIGAVGVLGWYIHRLIHVVHARTSYLAMVSMVTAGALGNIIDCVFYGRLFGYAGWFYGRVIDMLYFPLIRDASGECLFFRPVFNLADSCITIAILAIVFWFRNDLDSSLRPVSSPEANPSQQGKELEK
ncbi:MAG: signal peptidase II [Bacteroidales bacterium]|nr:signal peptidase II [Paludibacteraceae bacterium]MBP5758189.1 signal peptidase II [Bacteroidales bacterium]